MSLQVWLPLNGDLRNQGLSDLTFSNENTTNLNINETGKIGSCYQRASKQTEGRIISDKTINLDNDFSMCCWAYVMETVWDTANGLVTNHSHVHSTGCGITVKQVSTSDYRISCNTGTGSDRTFHYYYGTTNIKNAWHHLTLTYSKSKARLQLWVDGKVEYTLSNYNNASRADYIILFDWSTTYNDTAYRPACKLNDVRIYDHCLSAKEVKEISKGLVLHYKLGGTGGENLVKGNFSCTSTKDGYSQSGNVTCTLSQQDILDNLGKTLTFSYRVKSNGASTASSTDYRAERFGIHGGISGAYTNGASFTMYPFASHLACGKSDGIYTSSWAIPTNISALTTGLLLHIQTNSNDGFARPADDNNETWYLREVKLEWGDKATPWCPSKKDAEYTTLGFGNNIEYDCSGFGNDGTKVGDIAIAEGSPRYSTCTNFNASSYINCGKDAKVTDEITVNIWAHMSTWTTGYRLISCTETGGWNFESNNGYVTFPIYVFGKGYYSAISSKTWVSLSGGWHMFTGTYDGINAKLYIDGNLEATVSNGSSTKIPIGYNTSNSIFLHAEAGSSSDTPAAATSGIIKESDVRIYATALSADDIKALYNTPISIDADGNIHAYEFKEE